jgi:hypothetical protein
MDAAIEFLLIPMRSSRTPKDHTQSPFVEQENYLRRSAYRNTSIKVTEDFFNDLDMKAEYLLTLVREKNAKIPLLSSRYYFDKAVIEKYLKGDKGDETDLNYRGKKFDLNDFKDDQLFLADRLSGNVNSEFYRKHRTLIFQIYYSGMVNNNQGRFLLLMVRKEKGDKQLTKYLTIGFENLGSTIHKGKEHTIILAEVKK